MSVPTIAGRPVTPIWVFPAAVVVALAGGAVAAMAPVAGALAIIVLLLIVGIALRPAFAAYILLGVGPLIIGIDRGSVIPVLRPNEALAVILAAGLFLRLAIEMAGGRRLELRFNPLDASIIAMAFLGSVVPLLWLLARGQTFSSDDVLFALAFWKYYLVYRLVRASVSTEREVNACLWVAMASGAVVAVVGILQSLQLFGVPQLLASHYADARVSGLFDGRATSTLSSSIATADLMVFCLAIAAALLIRGEGHRRLLKVAVVLFMFGTIAAGQFSGFLGLIVAGIAITSVTGERRLLRKAVTPLLVASVALAPVVGKRLSSFTSGTGIPQSWSGRWRNLTTYFWPELFSHFHYLLGVRPSARVKPPEKWRDWVWIESGHTWLLWTGGLPLLISFFVVLWIVLKATADVARRGAGAIGAAAAAAFTAWWVIAILMVFDPHLMLRGSADLSFPLLALAFTATAVPMTRQPARPRANGRASVDVMSRRVQSP